MVGDYAVSSLTTAQWQTLAGLKPRLKPQVILYCHHYRGSPWPVVEDSLNQQHFHISPAAYSVLQRLDGNTTVARLADSWPGDDPQAELTQLLLGLYQANLLAGDFPVLAQNLVSRSQRGRWQRWLNPLAQRLPLINPDAWLKRCQPVTDKLFSAAGWWGWVALMAITVLVAAGHSYELKHHWHSRFLDPGNLLWLPLVYVVMKLFHEWAHGAMIRRFGGQCSEAGVMFLVFMPLPYVNAGAANSLPRSQRLWISAAGILAECAMAAVGLITWAMAGQGLLQDLAFNVLVVGFAASLLFNANPLMKFDGYYLLADAVQIPSLASRANQYLGYLWQRYGLGLASAHSPAELPGDKPWLAGYGIAAGAYRILILCWIVSFLAQRWLWAGLLVALWALAGQWLLPAAKGLWSQWHKCYAERREWRLLGVVAGSAAALYCLAFVMPLPHTSYAQGVVKLPDAAVFSAAPGFVDTILVADGQWVAAGAPIIQLRNTELQLQANKLRAELAEQRQLRQASLVRQPAQAQAAAMAMELVTAKLADLEQQLASLTLTAPRAGRLALPAAQNLPGRWVEEGDVLAHVFDGQQLQAQVLINQQDLAAISASAGTVRVKSALQPNHTFAAHISNLSPKAIDQLPSPVLGSAGGGYIPVDANDSQGLTTLQSWFVAELDLPASMMAPVVPNRLHVQFVHQNQPVGVQLWRHLRRWWLAHSDMG